MKKFTLVLGAFFIMVSNAYALDVGLGVELKSDYYSNGATVYVPIDISPSFRLEPHFMYFDGQSDYSSTSSSSSDSRTEIELGIGVFGVRQINSSTRLYYGARLSYLSFESEYVSSTSTYSMDEDGYEFAPTLGGEYFLSEKLSLGGEASWFYADMDSDSFSSPSSTSSRSTEMTGTDAEVILRYYF